MHLTIKNILLLVLFFILQVVWFNHIQILHRYIPIIFIYPLLRLPLFKDEIYFLILAFFMGISLDIISNTGGIFAATAVLITYSRKVFFYLSKNQAQDIEKIEINKLDFTNRVTYYLIFILLSQIIIYLLDAFNFGLLFSKLGHIIINSLLSLIFYIFFDLLFFNHQEK